MKDLLVAVTTGEVTTAEVYDSIASGVQAFMDEYNAAEPGDKGFMIGKLSSQVITTLVEGGALVKAIKDGSLRTLGRVRPRRLEECVLDTNMNRNEVKYAQERADSLFWSLVSCDL